MTDSRELAELQQRLIGQHKGMGGLSLEACLAETMLEVNLEAVDRMLFERFSMRLQEKVSHEEALIILSVLITAAYRNSN